MDEQRSRSRFAGGDQAYLRDEQYADSSRLNDRAALHRRYGTATVPWFDWVRQHLAMEPGQRVLEVGCGAGWLWGPAGGPEPVPSGVSLTLVDLSQGMVAEAVERATGAETFASVEGRPGDAQALPFGDGSFDRVVANHMLYHLPDPEQGVRELARVLAATGVAIVATNGRRHLVELHEVEAEVFGTSIDHETIEAFGAESGLSILRRHFTEVAWYAYDDELRCTDVDDVLAYVCSSPPGEDATAEQRAALRAALERRFVDGVLAISKDVGLFVCRP